jgi:tetratricopeptide (TPR) repeat protein
MHPISKVVVAFCCLLVSLPTLAEKHDKWFVARSPNFIVVSNAGDKQARKTAMQFEQIRSVFRTNLEIASSHPTPVITIIAAKDEGTLRELLPEYWAKGHVHPAGIFFGRMNQLEIAVQLDAPGPSPYAAIYHEYYHSLTLPYLPAMPVWLAEGLADFFGRARVDGQVAYMGEPDPWMIEALRQNKLIPLDVLFKVDHASPYYNETNRTSIFYAESWALTHYLVLGDNGRHRPLLMSYLEALSQSGTSKDEAIKAFGNLGSLQSALDKYISGNQFYSLHAPAPPPVADADVATRELSDAEVDAYLGGFAALRGHLQDAQPLLQQAIQLDPKLALAYQYLGLTQLFLGQRSEAFASFSQAVTLDPKNALTRYFRAYLTFGEKRVGLGDQQIENDLRQAIALDPNFAPPYGLLADYLSASNEQLPEALLLAQKGVSLEPGSANYMLTLAHVLARMQKVDQAQVWAQRASATALQPAERAAADNFLAYLQQAKTHPDGPIFVASGPATSRVRSDDSSDDGTNDNTPVTPEGLHVGAGVVTQSSCEGTAPRIELKTSTGTLVLHAPATGSLSINVSFPRPAGFNVCTSLKGMRVSALYKQDPDGNGGTMTFLRVIGPAGDDSQSGGDADTSSPGANKTASAGPETPAGAVTADGPVADVTCHGFEMFVQITASSRQLRLHSRDYTRLPMYDDRASADGGTFLPCTQLKSHTVSIIFIAADHAGYDGEIQSIEIEK